MMFLEAYKDTGYNLQIAKLKVSIRKLAIEIGYKFSEVELIIKEKIELIKTPNFTNIIFIAFFLFFMKSNTIVDNI